MSSLGGDIKHVSECFIKPKYKVEESKRPYYLTPWGVSTIAFHYMQHGLLFKKPKDDSNINIANVVETLQESLSLTLVYFYPLAGQFTTRVNEERHECVVFVDCNKGPGAKFIHATSPRTTISDILSATYVPPMVRSFFDLNGITNHDGHTQPLLSVKVTELFDGIFIAISMNHALTDGTSFHHFWITWSEIHRARYVKNQIFSIRFPPTHNTWSQDEFGIGAPLPLTNLDEYVCRYEAPQLLERIFNFSSESMQRIKRKANEESNSNEISSFQALTALVWRSMVRANRLPYDEITYCGISSNNRQKLDPPLPQNYFPNAVSDIKATTTVKELLEHSLGWAALVVHQSIKNYTDEVVRESLKQWLDSPIIYQLEMYSQVFSLLMTHSPRFYVYENEFGFGKPLAFRNGPGCKFAGNVAACPGYQEEGSIDLEVCLSPESMAALESDKEFMEAVSLPHILGRQMPYITRSVSKI